MINRLPKRLKHTSTPAPRGWSLPCIWESPDQGLSCRDNEAQCLAGPPFPPCAHIPLAVLSVTRHPWGPCPGRGSAPRSYGWVGGWGGKNRDRVPTRRSPVGQTDKQESGRSMPEPTGTIPRVLPAPPPPPPPTNSLSPGSSSWPLPHPLCLPNSQRSPPTPPPLLRSPPGQTPGCP